MLELNDESTTNPGSAEASTMAKDFHLEEFKVLKAEIDSAATRIERLTQYVLLISAVAYSLSFGINDKVKVPHQTAVLLLFFPLLCSIIASIVCALTTSRIRKKGVYIGRLEDRMAWAGFGWEHSLRAAGSPKGLIAIPWAAICIVNALIPLLWLAKIIQL